MRDRGWACTRPLGRADRHGEGWRDFLSAWEDWRVDVDEYRELDGERVLVLEDRSARAKISGLRIGTMAGKRGRRGRASPSRRQGDEYVTYFDRENALADLGLEE